MPPLPLIHINGFPGTGKLTIAQHLVTLLSPNASLVHNHLLVNPADAVLHRSQAGYQTLRKSIRTAIFTSLISEPTTHAKTYIFTDFQMTNDLGIAVCAEYAATAKARGCAFIPIVLTCNEGVNLARLREANRAVHGKLMDEELLLGFRTGAEIFRDEGNPGYLEVDVSGLGAEEAARVLLAHVLRLCPELGGMWRG